MKNLILILLIGMSITSCGIFKKEDLGTKKIVELHATIHKPFCGGTLPSPDVAKGYYESMKHEKFSLIEGTDYTPKSKIYEEFGLDESGNITLHLEPGSYVMVHSDKFLSLSEFVKLHQPYEKANFIVKENSCFEDWKNTVDLKFTVVNDTIIEYREKAKCWVGTNPCIEYVGPPAP